MTTKLILQPGGNYEIELAPRIDRDELDQKGVAVFIPETDKGWVRVQNHYQLSPVADPNDSDPYTFENGSKPRKK